MDTSLTYRSTADEMPIAALIPDTKAVPPGVDHLYIKESRGCSLPQQVVESIQNYCIENEIDLNDEQEVKLNAALMEGECPTNPLLRIVYEAVYDRDLMKDAKPKAYKTVAPPGNKFVPALVDMEGQRTCSLIAGAPGSGKTFIASHMIIQFKKQFPRYKVYVVSMKGPGEDETINKLGADKLIDSYLKITDMVEDEEETEEGELHGKNKLLERYRNSLILFDDVEDIQDVKKNKNSASMYNIVCNFKNTCIRVGRGKNIHVISTVHKLLGHQQTAQEHSCCTSVIIMRRGQMNGTISWLQNYLHCGKEQIAEFMKLDSRWLMFSFNPFCYVLSEKYCEILTS